VPWGPFWATLFSGFEKRVSIDYGLKILLIWWQKVIPFWCEQNPQENLGRPAGIRDIITFHGKTVDELETAFKEAVDDYIETCAKLGDRPDKPYSGKLTLRIPSSIHAAIATAAETSGKSLNKWVADILEQATHSHYISWWWTKFFFFWLYQFPVSR
jgi:predicted HicB family RNase H-like nuclease